MSTRKRNHTPDEILAIPSGYIGSVAAKDVIRRHSSSFDTLYRWMPNYGGERSEPHRLQAMEDESPRCTRVVADQALALQVLMDALGTDW